MNQIITPLDKKYDISSFESSNETLNKWLKQTAGQHQKNSISQTFLLIETGIIDEVLGFYTLAVRGLVPRENLPTAIAKKLPINVPAITLARLAIQSKFQGQKYGEKILVDAMSRAKEASLNIGGWALFVDAKDQESANFYLKYGFMPVISNPLMLFMPFANMPNI